MKRGKEGTGTIGVLAALGALVLALAPAAAAPQEPASGSVVGEAPGPGRYVGPASCGSSTCHGATAPRQGFDVRLDEYHLWREEDPHARAYEVLFDERSEAIAVNLGLAEAARAPQCLACHTLAPAGEEEGPLDPFDGISCEACHGPAGGWLGPHTEEGWSAAEDGEVLRMRDLSTPAARAELCLDCHLGDGERHVDHRLLAAGHPELPFELDNFSARVSHWREGPATDGAPAWAVGQVVALGRSLELVAARARAGQWPELAVLSCGDCHHSLDEERWRRAAPREGLGLPRWSPARWAVARHLVAAFAPERGPVLEAALGDLERRVRDLGGSGTGVAEAAGRAAAAVAEVRRTVATASWDRGTLVELIARIAGDARYLERADYDSAEQAFLALNTLTAELVRREPEILRGGLVDAIEELFLATRNPYRYDRERFATRLERVAEEVRRLR